MTYKENTNDPAIAIRRLLFVAFVDAVVEIAKHIHAIEFAMDLYKVSSVGNWCRKGGECLHEPRQGTKSSRGRRAGKTRISQSGNTIACIVMSNSTLEKRYCWQHETGPLQDFLAPDVRNNGKEHAHTCQNPREPAFVEDAHVGVLDLESREEKVGAPLWCC